MTGDFGHLMALALGSAVAYITAELLKGEPIYDALLKKSLSARPDKACEEERNIVEVPIGSGSLLEGKKIRDVPRMKQTIIIDLKRHGERFPLHSHSQQKCSGPEAAGRGTGAGETRQESIKKL